MSTWRQDAIRVIYQVLEANPTASEKELRAELRKAYPFGERNYHPYQAWLEEVKRAMARKFPKPLKEISNFKLQIANGKLKERTNP